MNELFMYVPIEISTMDLMGYVRMFKGGGYEFIRMVPA